MTDDELTGPDQALEQRLQAHWAAREAEPPAFETAFAAARQQAADAPHRSARPRWQWPAATAAALMFGVLVLGQWPSPAERHQGLPDTDQLLAELTTSTRWQAPTDQWLDPLDLPDTTIPDLESWTTEVTP